MLELTLIVPFYANPLMLAKQLDGWRTLPQSIRFVIVDDGSPEPAEPIVRQSGAELRDRIALYRIGIDIPWNRNGARNLGSQVAETDWIMHVDIDHTLPMESADALMMFPVEQSRWYRFPRYRVGAADETRRKDALPPGQKFGPVKPHIDSYLCTRKLFLANFYDEDYSGCLGGGSPFLKNLEKAAPVEVLPEPICLHVHTRDSVPDASDNTLSRETGEYTRRRKDKEARGDTKAKNPIRFPWSRVL